MSTALILPPTPWSFRPIAGLPLITRTVLSAVRARFERIVVMAGADGAQVRAMLSADSRTKDVEVVDGHPPPSIDNDHITVIPGDCVVTPATLTRLATEARQGRPLVFTRAEGLGSLVVCPGAALNGALDDNNPWQAVLEHVKRDGETVTLGHEACIRVSDVASHVAAERQLFAEMRAATAASDGPMARWFDRSLSQWISRRLVWTPVRPNHITIFGTTIGLLGAWCIAQGGYGLEVLGTFMFLCAVVLDGCDGEVARLKFQDTPFGHAFDITTDNVVHAAIFIALGVGQYRQHPDHDYRLLIAVFLGGIACAAATTYWCFLRNPPPSSAATAPRTIRGKIRNRLLRGFEAAMNRDFAYLLFVLAVVHRLEWFFWGAAFGTYAFSAVLLWVYRWRDAD